MEDTDFVTPFASSLVVAAPGEQDGIATGQYDPEKQYTIWNDPFADPLMGAPLCTHGIGQCAIWCKVPGSTNCSFGGCFPASFFQCDYDG